MSQSVHHFIGLDLGQAADFTAVVVVERQWSRLPDERRFAVRHLHRYPLGVPYPQMVEEFTALATKPPLGHAAIAVDATGVGRPVVDMFRRGPLAGRLCPILITAGHQATQAEDGNWHVPKKELAAVLQVLFSAGRLDIAKGLKHADTLTKELMAFKAKPTAAGSVAYEAWRERDHDDLVLALAMACWKACRPDGWDGYEAPETRGGDYSYSDAVAKLGGYRSPKW